MHSQFWLRQVALTDSSNSGQQTPGDSILELCTSLLRLPQLIQCLCPVPDLPDLSWHPGLPQGPSTKPSITHSQGDFSTQVSVFSTCREETALLEEQKSTNSMQCI